MTLPSPWVALILVAASFRIWRLLAEDTILDRPRQWVVRLPREWEADQEIPDSYRYRTAEFFMCPWCSGFWISLAVWGIWEYEPHWTEIILVPFAISAAVGVIRKQLDPPE